MSPLRVSLRWLVAAALLVTGAGFARAQKASITGTVVDSAARPVVDADVVAYPGTHRARTDSSGAFKISDLDGGDYTVRARRIGFAPTEWHVSVADGGHVDIKLKLDKGAVMLDTVTVVAGRACPMYSLDGFVCRRRAGKGMFLDYTDIDDKAVTYTADLFTDIPGFRETVVSGRFGPVRVAQFRNGFGCITSLVDGHPSGGAFVVPPIASELVAMEIYANPQDAPPQFQQYTWPRGDVTRTGRCAIVNYWTMYAPLHR